MCCPPSALSPPPSPLPLRFSPNKLIILAIVCIALGSRPPACLSLLFIIYLAILPLDPLLCCLFFHCLPGSSTQGSRTARERVTAAAYSSSAIERPLSLDSNDNEVLPFLLFSMPLVLSCLLFCLDGICTRFLGQIILFFSLDIRTLGFLAS